MKKRNLTVLGGLCVIAVLGGICTSAVRAQTTEVKEKPRMYTYFANWEIPRARWADFEKAGAATDKLLDQAVAGGTLVAYGDDTTIVHQLEGATHDNWWSAFSEAGVLDVLDSIMKGAPPPVLASATKHVDAIYVSHFYNWRAGTYKGAYTHAASYTLKSGAPEDAVESVSKNFIVPLMEKLLAAGAIVEYEIDEEAIHTESPNMFWVDYICPTSAGLEKVNAALGEAMKANPFAGSALESMVDLTVHRDYLMRSNVTYK